MVKGSQEKKRFFPKGYYHLKQKQIYNANISQKVVEMMILTLQRLQCLSFPLLSYLIIIKSMYLITTGCTHGSLY